MAPFTDHDIETFQKILDLFTFAFGDILENENTSERIQTVKKALYARDYMLAFGSQANLDAYVTRWTPSRALTYYWYLRSIGAVRSLLLQDTQKLNVMSIGGGAGAEVAAFAGMAYFGAENKRSGPIHMTALDIADWSQCLEKITGGMRQSWNKDQNGHQFSLEFLHKSAFDITAADVDLTGLSLITSFFTINELFAASKSDTIKLLKSFSVCKKGTLFLFLESAGSYSDIQVGSKIFPVHFVIHRTLTTSNSWKLLEGEDSKWFRLPSGLKYSLKLEDMRFFYKLYKKI